ncbi:unnamed protein product [Oikopleura dioica]|uniref:PPM-type phosphatase domain-containing protein n=1 Tax=Oikopleura dioica TaxID=34765 RepID=E4XNT5_OIKDI|nr:unnamed protein product [Oikopleura dioica]
MEIQMKNNVKLHVSIAEDWGARPYMQDATAIHFEKLKNSEECAAFAIYDGHGGDSASFFARDNMMKFIKKEEGFMSSNTEIVKKALKKAFLACHGAMATKLAQWPRDDKGNLSTAGTTAALVIIRGKQIFIVHCGDSAVWMGIESDEVTPWGDQPWKGRNLTEEHKPTAPKEMQRINAAGGKIRIGKQNCHRVVWTRPKRNAIDPEETEDIPFLNIARSLGNFWSWKESSKCYLVSPEPDVSVMNIDDFRYDARCLIIASDGVTNLMKPDEAAVIVHEFQDNREHGTHTGMLPAQLIVNQAIAIGKIPRRTQGVADNASAIVIIPMFDEDDTDEDDEIEEIFEDVEKPPEIQKVTTEAYIRSVERAKRKRAIKTTIDNKENHDSPAPAKKPKAGEPEEKESRIIERRHSERLAEREERSTRSRTRTF